MKFRLTFLFIIISFYSYSQIQNEKGKIVLETNDTVVGSITYYDDFSSTVTYVDNNNVGNSCTIDCIDEIILNKELDTLLSSMMTKKMVKYLSRKL